MLTDLHPFLRACRNAGAVSGSSAPLMRACLISLALGGLTSAPLPAVAAVPEDAPVMAIGVLGHDQGPASDHHEHGINLNLEMQLAPLGIFGSPRPHFGVTPNFNGDTSMAYAGLTFPLHQRAHWFLDGFVSAALHDGPLHKNPGPCARNSNCGYGVRVMPRFGLELGYRLNERSALTLFADHMSHKWVIPGENEGLEHTGLRYLRSF